MTHIKKIKINDEIVKPVDLPVITPNKLKGYDLFTILYSLIFLIAKKGSGKTVTLFHILKKCINKDTKVIIFSSTFHRDAVWREIEKWLKEKKIQYLPYTSILDNNGMNHVELLTEFFKHEYPEEDNQKQDHIQMNNNTPKKVYMFDGVKVTEVNTVEKKKKPSKIAPDYFIIFDDVSKQLSNPFVTALLKTHRHFNTKIVACSQYYNDMEKDARDQLDYLLLFPGISNDKIENIYDQHPLSIELPIFEALYKNATDKKYNFLYVDAREAQFRKNFNEKYQLSDETGFNITTE